MKQKKQDKAELEQNEMKDLIASHAECMQTSNTLNIDTQTDLTMNDSSSSITKPLFGSWLINGYLS